MGAKCATECATECADKNRQLEGVHVGSVCSLEAHDRPMTQPKMPPRAALTIMVVWARWIKSLDALSQTEERFLGCDGQLGCWSPRGNTRHTQHATGMLAAATTVAGIHPSQNCGLMRCFVEVTCGGNRIYTTQVIQTSMQPEWAEEFEVKEYTEDDEFEFKVYSIDLMGETDKTCNVSYYGKVLLKPHQFAATGFNGEMMMDEAGENLQAYLGLRVKKAGQEYPSAPMMMDEAGENLQAYLGLRVKKAGQEYPSAPPTTFTAVIEKGENKNYGVVFDTSDRVALMIFRVSDKGAVAEYNRKTKPCEQLVPTDFIISVNGVSSPLACIRQFQKPKVTCVVRRGIQVSLILKRNDLQKPLGVTFSNTSVNSIGITIACITEGAVREYNDECLEEEDKFHVHDRIINVNGETGTPADIKAKMMRSSGKFQYTTALSMSMARQERLLTSKQR
eukprot:CAMPEP_0172930142 /NCGR_PEP_ID=MMETSP1075-20121228/218839_1 /TAXON_ID=2916 /ORGANISM="Ceratium fusus, Strain PA161109" /LENGTH=448 /DNA_ID=CAMNT_0013791451 /DNA_START=20 /DNA_END=1366 /DNA_ORIENTATION=+